MKSLPSITSMSSLTCFSQHCNGVYDSPPIYFKDGGEYGSAGNISTVAAAGFVTRHQGFAKWYSGIVRDFPECRYIKILEVYPFGPAERAVGGFILADAFIPREDGKPPIPGCAFIRGDAVGVFVCIRSGGQKYVITTVQARVPSGSREYEEIPAGMLDRDKNFKVVALKELWEEVGLTANENEMMYLGDMYPSPGGCDEKIKLFYVEKDMSLDELDSLKGKCTGEIKEGEVITLRVRTMSDFKRAISSGEITDSKAHSALMHLLMH